MTVAGGARCMLATLCALAMLAGPAPAQLIDPPGLATGDRIRVPAAPSLLGAPSPALAPRAAADGADPAAGWGVVDSPAPRTLVGAGFWGAACATPSDCWAV